MMMMIERGTSALCSISDPEGTRPIADYIPDDNPWPQAPAQHAHLLAQSAETHAVRPTQPSSLAVAADRSGMQVDSYCRRRRRGRPPRAHDHDDAPVTCHCQLNRSCAPRAAAVRRIVVNSSRTWMPLLHACRRFPHPSTGRREDDDELSSIARDDDELMTGAGRARARARICDADDDARSRPEPGHVCAC